MGDKVGENSAALRAAVFLLSAKNRRGGVFKHPPQQGEGLQLNVCSYATFSPPRLITRIVELNCDYSRLA